MVLPTKELIYNYYIEKPKVIILGQDPYPTPGVANGLAFSVNQDQALPASLKNIFNELESDLKIKRQNGNLEDWKNQGIMLLNTALTVEAYRPGSHIDKWKPFTTELIKKLGQKKDLIWILWGKYAQNYKKYIYGHIIESSHPSPLSAHHSFFGSKPFSKTNKILKQLGKKPIKWG